MAVAPRGHERLYLALPRLGDADVLYCRRRVEQAIDDDVGGAGAGAPPRGQGRIGRNRRLQLPTREMGVIEEKAAAGRVLRTRCSFEASSLSQKTGMESCLWTSQSHFAACRSVQDK